MHLDHLDHLDHVDHVDHLDHLDHIDHIVDNLDRLVRSGEWDEAVITSVATNRPTNRTDDQLPDYRASPDFLLDLLDF